MTETADDYRAEIEEPLLHLLRQAKDALERCHDEHCALPGENGLSWAIEDLERIRHVIAAIEERLLDT